MAILNTINRPFKTPTVGVSWTPASLGANLAAWYDTTSVSLSNGRVVQWLDKSGNNRHSVISSETGAPLFQNNNIVYDGERYGNGTFRTIDFTTTTLGINQPFSIVVRAKINGNAIAPLATDYLIDGFDNVRTIITNNGNGNNDTEFYIGLISGALFPVIINRSTWESQYHTYTMVADGANSKAYLNGVEIAAGNFGTYSLSGLRFGASNGGSHGLNGEMPAAFISNSALTPTENIQAHTYLANIYS